MALTPFNRGRALYHGRLSRTTAVDGTHVFQLGDERLIEGDFAVGDYADLAQSVTIDPSTTTIRFALRIKPPPSLPAGQRWRLAVRFNSVEKWAMILPTDPLGAEFVIPTGVISTLGTNQPAADLLSFRLQVVV